MENKYVELLGLNKVDTPVVRAGKIVAWNSGRGFGWLECEGEKVFVHLREFKGTGVTPALDVEFPFVMGTDVQGRPCAKGLSTCLINGKVGAAGWLLLAALLVWPIVGATHLPVVFWVPLLQMVVLSLVVYKLYAYDKRQAIHYASRVPQTIMHLGELAGGWPGAFIAQRILRHKSTKKTYQSIFWGIILLHQVVGFDFVFDHKFSMELWDALGESRIFN